MKLIEIGGRELVMRETVLHDACEYRTSIEVISKLLEIGGRKLAMEKSPNGYTVLQTACQNKASIEVVSKLIGVGGVEILSQENDDGHNILDHYFHYLTSDDVFVCIVKKYILAQIGGEFGIGGLFNAVSKNKQEQIYNR